MATGFNILPGTPFGIRTLPQLVEWCHRLLQAAHMIGKGKLNCTGTVTLRASEATTVVTLKGVASPLGVIHFDPLTANAKADYIDAGFYVLEANRGADSFTITHPNNANADKKFFYSIIGG